MTNTVDNTVTDGIFIQGLNYYVGALQDISTIDFLKEQPEKLAAYYKMGLKTYSESTIPMIEMAYYSVKKTLKDINIAPTDIDLFIYIAEHKGRDEYTGSNDVMALMNYLGLPNAYPMGLFLSDCANIMAGIQVAQALVQCGQARNVMVVCSNRFSSRGISRSMQPEVAIGSDSAVSLCVSKEKSGFEVLGLKMQKNDPPAPNAPLLDQSIKKIKALRMVTKAIMSETGLTQKDISRVYVNNYAELSQIFVENCGFDASLGFYDNFGKYAHCLAGDTIMSLKDQNEHIRPGEKIYTMTDGPNGSYGLCLQKV